MHNTHSVKFVYKINKNDIVQAFAETIVKTISFKIIVRHRQTGKESERILNYKVSKRYCH